MLYFIPPLIWCSSLLLLLVIATSPRAVVFKSVSPDGRHRVTEVHLIKHTHIVCPTGARVGLEARPHTLAHTRTHSTFVDLVFFVGLCNWLNVNFPPKVHRSLCLCLLFVCVRQEGRERANERASRERESSQMRWASSFDPQGLRDE